MLATQTLLTGDDLLHMPDNGKRYELVRGELVEVRLPGGEHGECSAKLGTILDAFAEEQDLGQVALGSGFYLERDPDTVRGPDILFFSKKRLDPDEEVEGCYEIPPDLAVEIVSPSNTLAEVNDKVEEYLRAGVRMVWVVHNRRRTVTVYPGEKTLTEEDTLKGGRILPGFAVSVSRLFRRKRSSGVTE